MKPISTIIADDHKIVLDGLKSLTPHIAGELFLAVRNGVDQDQQDNPIARLTPRQQEVLQLVAEGHTAQQFAGALCISRPTVEFHKYKIMDTWGVKSSSDLVAVAIKLGGVTI